MNRNHVICNLNMNIQCFKLVIMENVMEFVICGFFRKRIVRQFTTCNNRLTDTTNYKILIINNCNLHKNITGTHGVVDIETFLAFHYTLNITLIISNGFQTINLLLCTCEFIHNFLTN